MPGVINDADIDALPLAEGDFLTAQLSSRYFHAGGVVRGVVHLHPRRTAATTEPAAAGAAPSDVSFVVAQIHAHVTVDSNLLTVPVVQLLSPRSALRKEREQRGEPLDDDGEFDWDALRAALPDVQSFAGNAGTCIYQSAPTTLLTDAPLADITRDFVIALPQAACPTFRGTAARVVYVLTVTAQRAGRKPVSVHLPFEVYASEFFFQPAALETADEYAAALGGGAGRDAADAPPSPQVRKERSASVGAEPVGVRKGAEVPFALRPSLMHGRVETESAARAQTSIFTIGKDNSHLVRFLLTKQSYAPGDVVLGVFDFARAALPCFEVAATLVLEESLGAMALEPGRVVSAKELGDFHEYTDGVLQTHAQFCVPPDALPTVRTDLVSFQWLLRFEFTAGVAPEPGAARSALKRQTFRWQVPIVVRPAAPAPEREAVAAAGNIPHRLFSGSRQSVKLE